MNKFQVNIAFLILTVAAALFLFACAPPTVKTGRAVPATPDEQLFAKAKAAQQQEAYGKAISLYDQYLVRFPEGKRVAAVLFQMGQVLAERGDFSGARKRYEALLSRFPESDHREAARLGILESWYQQQEYRKAIQYADTLTDASLSPQAQIHKYCRVADSYLALEQPLDAAYILVGAMRKLSPSGQQTILASLDQATRKMSPQDLQILLADIDDVRYRGRLTCRLGEKYMERGDYDRAVSVLSAYIEEFPDNAFSRQARQQIVMIDQQATYDRYAIGCLLPLSGKYKVFGEKALQGINLALQKIGAEYSDDFAASVKLIIRDTGSDSQQAVRAVKALTEKKVAAIIGPLEPVAEAVQIAQDNHIPLIAMTQKQNFPGIGTYVFRNFLTPPMQVRELVAYACEDLGLQRLAVLYPDETYGRVFAHMFWDEVLQKEATIVGFESYDPQDTDFAGPIQRLVGRYYEVPEVLREIRDNRLIALGLVETAEEEEEATVSGSEEPSEAVEPTPEAEEKFRKEEEEPAIVDFEALFIPDGPSNVGLILPQLAYHDVRDPLFLGTNLWHCPELIRMAKIYADGSVMPTGFWERRSSEQVNAFVRQFQTLFAQTPGFVSAVAYDTAKILFSVLAEKSPAYRSGIRNEIYKLKDFSGVTGRTAFEASGEAVKSVPLLKIEGRNFVHVERPSGSLSLPTAISGRP